MEEENESHTLAPNLEQAPQFNIPKKSNKLKLLYLFICAVFLCAVFTSLTLLIWLNNADTSKQNNVLSQPRNTIEAEKKDFKSAIASGEVLFISSSQLPPTASESEIIPSPIPTVNPEVIKNDLPNGYGGVVYSFSIPKSATTQAISSVSSNVEIKDKFSVELVNPEGKKITLPIFDWDIPGEIQKSTDMEHSGKSLIHKIGKYDYMIKLLAEDTEIQPFAGDWQMIIIASAGSQLVLGDSAL